MKPGFDSGLPKAPVPAESNMWNPSGARLSPDPVSVHSEALGELVSSEQAIHHVSLDEANRCRRA